MTWVRLDDGYYRNPKSRALGRDGRALHIASMCWCAANLTDGIIRTSDLPLLLAEAEVKRATVAILVAHRAWIEQPDGWEVNDFLTYNRPAAAVEAERLAARERMAKNRGTHRNGSPDVQANNGRSSPVRSPYPDPTRPDPTQLLQVTTDDDSRGSSNPSSSVEDVLDLIVPALAIAAGKETHRAWQHGTRLNQRRENGDTIATMLTCVDADPMEIAGHFADPVHIRQGIAQRAKEILT